MSFTPSATDVENFQRNDYFQVLGVSRDASSEEIKKTFKKIAMANHPDNNPGDKKAEERFKAANEAYEVLSDSEKRLAYLFIHDRGVSSRLDSATTQNFGSATGNSFADILSELLRARDGFESAWCGVRHRDKPTISEEIETAKKTRGVIFLRNASKFLAPDYDSRVYAGKAAVDILFDDSDTEALLDIVRNDGNHYPREVAAYAKTAYAQLQKQNKMSPDTIGDAATLVRNIGGLMVKKFGGKSRIASC